MDTFQDRFCASHRCTAAQFQRRVFWRCLHRRAYPLAPIILLLNKSYFAPDLNFVEQVGRCTEMDQVWEETRLYFTSPLHKRWLRRRADVRISAHKVINLAALFLPAGTSRLDPRGIY
jgi:hypothetical protein